MRKDIYEENAEPDCERLSYTPFAYKRVQKLRRKGERRGIRVPRLNYELTKPEEPRTVFMAVAVVSALLLVAIVVGLAFLYNYLIKTLTIFDGAGDVLKAVFDPKAFALSAGLSAIPGIMVVLAYILLITMLILPIIAVVYVYRFVRDVFYMAKCSKEEFAKGNIVSSRITGLVVGLIASTVVLVIVLLYTSLKNAFWVWLVYGGIVLLLGGLLAIIAVEKAKCAKWFAGLDYDRREDYLNHDRALRRVKSRLKFERQMWNDLGR